MRSFLLTKTWKLLFVSLAGLALILLGVGTVGTARLKHRTLSLFQTLTGPEPNTLNWYVQDAQANGISNYQFFAGITEYAEPASWGDVLANYTLIVVEPLEARGYPTFAEASIETWYRFRVVETLSKRPLSQVFRQPPPDFPAPQAGEVVSYKYGGTLVRDGVTLTAIDPEYPQFTFSQPPQKYLLTVELNPQNRVATIVIGQFGVYTVSSSGVLAPINEDNPYQQEISSRYNNSLDQLRASLNGTPNPTPTPTPPTCNPSNFLVSKCHQLGGSWDYESCSCAY